MTIKASSPKKEGKGLTSVSHDLNRGQRVLVIGGPRKGQRGSVHDITDCMYELTIDNGEVGHVWKENVQAEHSETTNAQDAELHYKLGKAVKKLKAATAEVEELYALIGIAATGRDKK